MRIQTLIKQLNILKQCGMLTAFDNTTTPTEKKVKCVIAVALMDGYEFSDLEGVFWQKMLSEVRMNDSFSVSFNTDKESVQWTPLLTAASELFNHVS